MTITLTAGYAKTDITPPVGVELAGFGYNIERKSTGVLDPLFAKAFVWEGNGTRGAIIVCDLIGVKPDITAEIRRIVEERCGIPGDHVLISCTHTHAGPATVDIVGWGEMDETYLKGLPERVAQSVIAAGIHMEEVTLEYGEAAVNGISFNRETRNDQVQAGLEHGLTPAEQTAELAKRSKAEFGGLTDTTMKVVKVKRRGGDGKLLAFFAHYSCHPVVLCASNPLISGDFTALATDKISAQYDAFGMFLQGSTGDQDPVYCHDPQEVALQNLPVLTDRLAGFMAQALDNAQPLPVDVIAVKRIKIRLPLQVLDQSVILRNRIVMADFAKELEQLPMRVQRRVRFERDSMEAVWQRFSGDNIDVRETELQGIRFGDLLMLANPSELFYTYHTDIERELAPFKVFVLGLSNDSIGYIPTPDKFDTKKYSYPAWFAPYILKQFPFQPNIGEIFSGEIIELGRTLARPGQD